MANAASEGLPVPRGTAPLVTSASPSTSAAAAADRLRRSQKPISFQKMAMIQEELARIEAHLETLRAKEANDASTVEVSSPGALPRLSATLSTEEVIDPELVYMLIVELCQLCASGDAVGARILLSGGADPNSRDYDDRALLHLACLNGHAAVVDILLEFGADPTVTDRDGRTPMDLAEENGYTAIVQTLLTALGYDPHACAEEAEADSVGAQTGSSCVSSPASPYQPDFSSVPQPMVGSLIVVMVGLPGRGKSFVAQQIRRYFQWNGLACTIFSPQMYKRRLEKEMLVHRAPSVADPSAGEAAVVGAVARVAAVDVDKRVTAELAKDLTKFVSRTGGVAVLDGSHSTYARRQALLRAIKESQRIKQNRVVFVEIVNNSKEVVHRNILRAMENTVNPSDNFVEQYYSVIAQHEAVYKTLSAVTDSDLSFIRIEDNTTYSLNMISGWMPSRLAYMLHNLSHTPKNLYLTRAGEHANMVAGRLGGSSRLTERGMAYSLALYNFFREEVPVPSALTVMTSCSKQCTQTVHHFAEEARKHSGGSPSTPNETEMKLNCRVSYFPTLDDINHGDCEGQLLSDVCRTMPNTLQAMRADPYYTAWPNGECIHQVFNARLEPHIHDIQASSSPVLVVSHLHLLQGLYSYFVTAADKTVAPQNAYQIDIPFESVLRIRTVGLERVDEIIDLSGEVDRITEQMTGKVIRASKPKDDFQIFPLQPRSAPSRSDGGADAARRDGKEK